MSWSAVGAGPGVCESLAHAFRGEFTIVTPYPPSANHYKKERVVFSPKTKKHIVMVYADEVAKQFRKDVAYIARKAGVTLNDGRVSLHIALYPERPQDWASRARKRPEDWDDTVRCIDVGNAEKCISDALNGIAWHDDKQVRKLEVERMMPDEHGARCVVTIRKIETKVAQKELL